MVPLDKFLSDQFVKSNVHNLTKIIVLFSISIELLLPSKKKLNCSSMIIVQEEILMSINNVKNIFIFNCHPMIKGILFILLLISLVFFFKYS